MVYHRIVIIVPCAVYSRILFIFIHSLYIIVGVMPGASVRNSAHGKGHEEGGFGIHKDVIKPQETPCSRASTPQTRVCLLYCFMLSPIPLTLRGGWPPLPLSEKELTYNSKSIKIPGCDKNVSTYELLWRLSSLPVQVPQATCDCLQPSNRERHEMF